MSIDARTRCMKDLRAIPFEEVADALLPEAIARRGDLAARGVAVRDLPDLGLRTGGGAITLAVEADRLVLRSGAEGAGLVVRLEEDALSALVQDYQSTTGLAMTARVSLEVGRFEDWVGWETVLRALLDGRPVFEPGSVPLRDAEGRPLDLDRIFGLDDEREEMAHFLREAGFLHVRSVFTEEEMASVGRDIDRFIEAARPDDGDSWWAEDANGQAQAVRVLEFYDKSEALRSLVHDDRYQWIGDLTGDGHAYRRSAEGLVKPLGIAKGLSDLPWHKDCGQGRHSLLCNGLTCGISVTGADRVSGALGVLPGSHRANLPFQGLDPHFDHAPRMLETRTGDVTIHCSDTLHRAHPPVERPRKVVYSGFRLPPLAGDEAVDEPRYAQKARAELTDVMDRLEAAGSRFHTRDRASGTRG